MKKVQNTRINAFGTKKWSSEFLRDEKEKSRENKGFCCENLEKVTEIRRLGVDD